MPEASPRGKPQDSSNSAETKKQQSQKEQEYSRTYRKGSADQAVLGEGDIHIRKSVFISILMFKITANKMLFLF